MSNISEPTVFELRIDAARVRAEMEAIDRSYAAALNLRSAINQRTTATKKGTIMRTITTIIVAVLSAAVIAACGGEATQEQCQTYRAAWYSAAGADAIALTGPEHSGLRDAELQAVGKIHAAQDGLAGGQVLVGDWAQCTN